MKIKLTNMYYGNVELVYGEVTVILQEGQSIILTEKEYESIPKHKQYLIQNGFILAEFVVEEEVKKDKNFKHK